MLVLGEYFLWLMRTNHRATNRLDVEGYLLSIMVVKRDLSESVSFSLGYDLDNKLLQATKKSGY